MNPTRRTVLLGTGAVIVAAAGFGGWRLLSTDTAVIGAAEAQDASGEALLEAGPLGDKTLGEADAPVTVIEYASMTCGHCASFHADTYPQFKSEYVDTGKVRFIFREFPLDPVATAAFMLARCIEGEDRYFPFVEAMFDQQQAWAFADNPEEGLFNMARQAGFTREKFEACLTNQEILDGVNAVRERAADEFDVNSTPTFFINGEIFRGVMSFEQMQEVIERHLSA